ncbi:MAG: sulfotransferase [Deltaproteobacteria bacterium]|nr:sulfotransferase [Deltaproteobacteria bacterium]
MTSQITTTLIGRGHSGTRAFCKLLVDSGMYMGPKLSHSYCYSPINAYGRFTGTRIALHTTVAEGAMYEAARIFAGYVDQVGDTEWDFTRAIEAPIPKRFIKLVDRYLAPIDDAPGPRGWKLPETLLMFPWLTRIRPEIRYVHWVRDPRDVLLHRHLTDDLTRFNIPANYSGLRMKWIWDRDIKLRRRAISWKYQHDLVQQSPKPEHWMVVRFEDFILDHENEIEKLSKFLEVPLSPIPVNAGAVGRWKDQPPIPSIELLRPLMDVYSYE